jgi:putative transposase
VQNPTNDDFQITDKILPEVNEWQNRPLETIYPIIYLTELYQKPQDNQIVTNVLLSFGIDMNGQKDILGIWISENESASFYASICSDLKKRGITDIFVACHDNLKGLGEAINAISPKQSSSFA